MVKTKRVIGMALAVIFTTATMMAMPAQAATKKKVVAKKTVVVPAKVTTVDGPADEYQPGDPVEVTVKAANTSAKVQYRVSMVNAGKRVELYTAKTKFFGPALSGKAETVLKMKAFGRGTAAMVVYAKAVGSTKVYDSAASYKFVVQPRPVVEPTEAPTEEPTVAPTEAPTTAPTVAPVTFAVSTVKAVTEGAVTVTCEAITATQAAATVKVVNPAGQTIEVVPQDLAAGATEATFAFKTAQTLVDGNYTVDGKTFEVTVPLAVSSVNAVDGTVTVKFNKTVTPAAVLADFTVNKTVTTTSAVTTAVVPTAVATTGSDVTLTVPAVAQTTTDQAVVYSVAYKTAKAVDAPSYTVAKIPALGVVAVTALNSRQVKVEFTKAVDSSTLTADNVKVYIGSATTATTWKANVAADKKSVVLGLDATIPQDTNVKVTVDAVADSVNSSELISGYSATAHMTDVTAPAVTGITIVTSKTFKITVSEPLSLEASADQYHVFNYITIDGIKLVGQITQNYAKNEITVQLGSSLAVGEHTFVISGYKDFAGFIAPDFTGKATVVADSTAPSVKAVTVNSRHEIDVTFDEPVNSLGTITVAGNTITTGTPSSDKTTYTLTLGATTPLTLSSIVQETLTYVGTTDMEGNAVSTAKTFIFKNTDDTTIPTATISISKTNAITIVFSKLMSDAGKITVKDSVGTVKATNVVPVQNLTDDATGKTYTVAAAAAGLSGVTAAGNYTVTLKGAVDDTVRQNPLAETTVTLAGTDITAPYITYAILTTAQSAAGVTPVVNAKVTVYFNEAMDTTTLANLSNYTVNIAGTAGVNPQPLTAITNAVATPAADGKSVALTIPNATTSTVLYALVLKDLAGNMLSTTATLPNYAFNQPIAVSANALPLALVPYTINPDGTPGTDYARMTATNTIKIKFINPMAVVDPSQFTLTKADGTAVLVGIASSLSSDKLTATLTFNASLNADGTYGTNHDLVTLTAKKLLAVNVVDIYGGKLANDIAQNLVDLVSPTASVATGTDAGTVKLSFNEAVKGAIANDLVVRDSDGAITTVTVKYYAANGTEVTDPTTSYSYVVISGLTPNDTYTVTLLGRTLADLNANTVNDLAATSVVAK